MIDETISPQMAVSEKALSNLQVEMEADQGSLQPTSREALQVEMPGVQTRDAVFFLCFAFKRCSGGGLTGSLSLALLPIARIASPRFLFPTPSPLTLKDTPCACLSRWSPCPPMNLDLFYSSFVFYFESRK
jgi:hypothetical protein